MKILASVQAERTGRVYIILVDAEHYYWARASPGRNLQGPFNSLPSIYSSMSMFEGKSAAHWREVFEYFQTGSLFPATKSLTV